MCDACYLTDLDTTNTTGISLICGSRGMSISLDNTYANISGAGAGTLAITVSRWNAITSSYATAVEVATCVVPTGALSIQKQFFFNGVDSTLDTSVDNPNISLAENDKLTVKAKVSAVGAAKIFLAMEYPGA